MKMGNTVTAITATKMKASGIKKIPMDTDTDTDMMASTRTINMVNTDKISIINTGTINNNSTGTMAREIGMSTTIKEGNGDLVSRFWILRFRLNQRLIEFSDGDEHGHEDGHGGQDGGSYGSRK